MVKSNKAYFKTNVLLKSIIGKDLINNDNIAILELVKNSYDAGSRKVYIDFKNIVSNDDERLIDHYYTQETSKIIVQDWGSGMTIKDVRDKWLNIAYSEKKIILEEFGRTLAGAKGIGRFSCDRLGKYLDLFTKVKTEELYTHLQVDWTNFEIEGNKDLEIQKIPVLLRHISKSQFKEYGYSHFDSGTLIEISKLRDKWYNKIKDENVPIAIGKLREYLERLINPNQIVTRSKSFEILLQAKEFNDRYRVKTRSYRINGPIENKIFSKLDFKTTSIEANIYKVDDQKVLETVLKDKGRVIFELKEDISEDPNYRFIINGYIVIYFLNTYAKSYFKKQTGQRSIQFGSIHLFKNGFRISPYGDEGDDWLGLEIRKGQGQRRFLGTRDIVGRIELRDKINSFREITSREGLVQNEPFHELKYQFFYPILRILENYVVNGLRWDSIPTEMQKHIKDEDFEFQEELFQLSQEQKDYYGIEAIRSIVKTHGQNVIKLKINSDLIATLAEEEKEKFEVIYKDFEKLGAEKIDKDFKASLNEIRKLVEKKEQEIQILRENKIDIVTEDLFSRNEEDADIKEVIALQHHINQASQRIQLYLNQLRASISSGDSKNNHFKYIDLISFENRKVATLSRFVTKAKFNLITTYVTKDLVQFILEYVKNVYTLYDHKIINRELVEVIVLMREPFQFVTVFRPIDFVIIIDNLLDNSYKAGAKRVELSIIKKGRGNIELKFHDNGNGLDPKINNPEDIFNFGVTTSRQGTGIGLYHVKSILKKMGGKIEINSKVNKGIEFIIKIPQNEK